MRKIFFPQRRPNEAFELLPQQRQSVPLQNLQQRTERAPPATHEDPQERQTSRLRDLRRALRPKISTNSPPKNTQRRKTLQMPGVLESVRTLDSPQIAHQKTHRRETLQMRTLPQHRLLPTPPPKKTHALHPQNQQTLPVFTLQILSQNKKRSRCPLHRVQRIQRPIQRRAKDKKRPGRTADGRRKNAIPSCNSAQKNIETRKTRRARLQQTADRRRFSRIDQKFRQDTLPGHRAVDSGEIKKQRTNPVGVDRAQRIHGQIQTGTTFHRGTSRRIDVVKPQSKYN